MKKKLKSDSPLDAATCSPSSSPRVDAALVDHMPAPGEWSQHYLDLARLARTLENEAEFYKSALSLVPVVDVKELRKRLYDLPELVLANEKKNPAWGKAELWGIERDIIPSVRALCWSAAAILPENAIDDESPRNEA